MVMLNSTTATTMPGSESMVSVIQHTEDNGQPHRIFYLSGQSIVFKVEGTLFKVDPALFTRGEDSALKTMLSLPQGDNSSHEGSYDASPVILYGDTPAQFETLLWGLHSRKLFQAHVSVDDVDRYVQLAKISHKYDMQGLEAWATSGLASLAQADICTRGVRAVLLLDVFYLCNCTDAGNLVLKTVKEMLNAGTCSTADIIALIDIGQRYNLPGLISRGYYAMMLKPRNVWETEATFSWTDRYRLLNGHYSLSEYSLDSSIESLAKKFAEHHPTWGSAWTTYAVPSKEEETRKLHTLKHIDIAGRLKQLVEAFLRDIPAAPSEVEDIHVTVFRGHLERIVDDLFETKFSLYFVAPAVSTGHSN